MGGLVSIDNTTGREGPARMLRELAAEVEAGKHGKAPRVVVVVGEERGGILFTHVREAGSVRGLVEIVGTLEMGKAHLLEPEVVDDG